MVSSTLVKVKRQTSSTSTNKEKKSQQQQQSSQDWQVGELLIHDTFGEGEVTHVFGSGKKVSIAVKFPGLGQKILDPKQAKLQRIR